MKRAVIRAVSTGAVVVLSVALWPRVAPTTKGAATRETAGAP